MKDYNSNVYLTLDRKSNRIRITDEVLSKIGSPKYLQILINPESRLLLIRAISNGSAAEQAYKVKHQPSKSSYIELYSASLLERFGKTFTEFVKGKSYKIFGGVLPNHNVLYFDLRKYKTIEINILE